MSEETLLTASRRAVRYFNIDMNSGGLITSETQHAIETLDKQVRLEAAREKATAEEAPRCEKCSAPTVDGRCTACL